MVYVSDEQLYPAHFTRIRDASLIRVVDVVGSARFIAQEHLLSCVTVREPIRQHIVAVESSAALTCVLQPGGRGRLSACTLPSMHRKGSARRHKAIHVKNA